MDDAPGFDDIPETALAWHRDGRCAVLATVVETWGSAPRPVGSQLAISGKTDLAGSVSGGCVEGAVAAEALAALEACRPRMLTYGVTDENAFEVGLACGGTIRVMVEPVGAAIDPDLLDELCRARAARRAIAYIVDTDAWTRRLAGPDDPALGAAIAERMRKDRSGFEENGLFIAIHNPPLRLAVIGAVHIAQPLVTMARLAGYDVALIDPREAFGSATRFPGEAISHDYPDEALAEHGLDARTAVVTLSHDPKIDDPAIIAALSSDVFYLGCLGSKRTHAKRVERLKTAGFSDDQIARIHAPVGLDIGAMSPAEIAVAILAEVTQALRRA